MKRRIGILSSAACFAMACALIVGGCDRGSTTGAVAAAGSGGAGSVAVFDMNRVSDTVGWKSEFETNLKTADSELANQLNTYGKAIKDALDNYRTEFANKAGLNEDQKVKLASPQLTDDVFQKIITKTDLRTEYIVHVSYAQRTAQEAQQAAQKALKARYDQLQDVYRQAVKPVVRRVADANGYAMVMDANAAFYVNDKIDLTNKVVDELQKAMPAHTMPGPPTNQLPTTFAFPPDLMQRAAAPAAAPVPAAPAAPTSRPQPQ